MQSPMMFTVPNIMPGSKGVLGQWSDVSGRQLSPVPGPRQSSPAPRQSSPARLQRGPLPMAVAPHGMARSHSPPRSPSASPSQGLQVSSRTLPPGLPGAAQPMPLVWAPPRDVSPQPQRAQVRRAQDAHSPSFPSCPMPQAPPFQARQLADASASLRSDRPHALSFAPPTGIPVPCMSGRVMGPSASAPLLPRAGEPVARTNLGPLAGEKHPLADSPDQELSSIHMACPGSQAASLLDEDQDEQQLLLDGCFNTTQLVTQLAATLKTLEADVNTLRMENQHLRTAVSHAIPRSANGIQVQASLPDGVPLPPWPPQRALAQSQSDSRLPCTVPLTPVASRGTWTFASPHFGQSPLRPAPGSPPPVMTSPGSPERQLDSVVLQPANLSCRQVAPEPIARLPPSPRNGDFQVAPHERVEKVEPPAVTEAAWALKQSFWLCGEGEEASFLIRAPLLEQVHSVDAAVAVLNGGATSWTWDLCIVHSAANRGYYLLYRRACKEQAVALAYGGGFEDALSGIASAASGSCARRSDQGSGECGPSSSGDAVSTVSPNSLSQMKPPLHPAAATQASPAAVQRSARVAFTETRTAADCDDMITRYEQIGDFMNAEQCLRTMLRQGRTPSSDSFHTVIASACRRGAVTVAEELLQLMLESQHSPSQELFELTIDMYAECKDAVKVEEWLLAAGNQGFTPEQRAFENVVLLFASKDTKKAEEWLSRVTQTQYRLPNSCYDEVIRAFAQAGDARNAHEWLLRMIHDKREPSIETVSDVISALVQSGEKELILSAEMWTEQLVPRKSDLLSELQGNLFEAALRIRDLACASRLLAAVEEVDSHRMSGFLGLCAERRDGRAASSALQTFCKSAELTESMATQAFSASAGDCESAEAIARLCATAGCLTPGHAQSLRRILGSDRTTGLLRELNIEPRQSDVPRAMERRGSQLSASSPGRATRCGGRHVSRQEGSRKAKHDADLF